MNDINLPPRPKTGHKGTFGTVAVFAGHISSKSVMLGSAEFIAKAALKSGVGLVEFFADQKTLIELIKMVPQAVGYTYSSFDQASKKWKSVVVGSGWESTLDNIDIFKKILELKIPTVIDGEALNILSKNTKLLNLVHENCVLTPHIGEFKRLSEATNITDPRQFAKNYNCALVLKSNITKIYNGDNYWEYEGNNPALATGGSGDVLAGLIGGLLAQSHHRLSNFEVARVSVQVHSKTALKFKEEGNLNISLFIDSLDIGHTI